MSVTNPLPRINVISQNHILIILIIRMVTSHCLGFYYSHCNSLVSMSSSSVSSTTTRMTQATRKQLKPADSRQTCHSAALRPQHGFSQFDLTKGRGGEIPRGGDMAVRGDVSTKINGLVVVLF